MAVAEVVRLPLRPAAPRKSHDFRYTDPSPGYNIPEMFLPHAGPAMTAVPLICLVAAAAYLMGAIPTGYLIAHMKGVDILKQGSGNIGATNVARVLGLRWGILVFLLDFAKGAV